MGPLRTPPKKPRFFEGVDRRIQRRGTFSTACEAPGGVDAPAERTYLPGPFRLPSGRLRMDPRRLPLRSLALVATALAAFLPAGCHTAPALDGILVSDAPARVTPGGPAGRPVARTLPVEVFFLRCPPDAGGEVESLWSRVDEQAIDGEVRRSLAANGLRAGILRDGIPEGLLAGLEPPVTGDETAPPPAPNGADATPPVVRRVLRLLPGRESEVVSLKASADLVVMQRDDDGLHGATYGDALPHFVLRAWPAADGRTRVDLVPVIRHGPVERSWIGEDGAFKIETGQRRQVLEGLRFEAVVPSDGMLVVGPAGDESATVGDALFRPRLSGRAGPRLLAMRPLGPGIDPMFGPGEPSSDDPPREADTAVAEAPTGGR